MEFPKELLQTGYYKVSTQELITFYKKCFSFEHKMCLAKLESNALEETHHKESKKQEIEKPFKNIREEFEAVCEKSVEQLQAKSDELLKIPVVKSKDGFDFEKTISEEDYKKTRDENIYLEKKYLKTRAYLTLLENTLETIEKTKELLDIKDEMDKNAEELILMANDNKNYSLQTDCEATEVTKLYSTSNNTMPDNFYIHCSIEKK